jgi:hypothetical protein
MDGLLCPWWEAEMQLFFWFEKLEFIFIRPIWNLETP